MAEVKTGLEGILGYMTENGTLGKVYYNALAGSAGTKNLGVGTSATTGANAVTVGSGLCCSGGFWTAVPGGNVTIGSAGQSTVCVGIEAGSDGLSKVTGGTAASVSAAVSARAGTTAGKTPLGYVTVGTSGSVLSGSIIDERTMLTSATISYVTGFDYSLDENTKGIWNRATFAHYKKGRRAGKFTVKEQYVEMGSADVWPTSSTYKTVPTLAFELAIDDIAGTIGQSVLFMNCGKDSMSFSQPEEDVSSFDMAAAFGTMTRF